MTALRVLIARIRAMVQARRLDRELDEELRTHLEMEAEANLRRGMGQDEARRSALHSFGNLTRTMEGYRELRGLPIVETLALDIRYAVRLLRKTPTFTLVAITSLALGVGCNTAIISVLNAVLWRPLPVRDADRLAVVTFRQPGASTGAFSYPDYLDVRQRAGAAFDDLLAYRVGLEALSADGQAERILVHYVTGNYFTLLGLKPAVGRLILPSEGELPLADPVLVLGHSYWQTRFGGDPGVVGRRVLIDGHPFTIVGVAPRQFRSVQALIDVEGYLPLGMLLTEGNYPRDVLSARNMRLFSVMGRLRHDVTEPTARAVLSVVAKQLTQADPSLLTGAKLELEPEAYTRIPLGGTRRVIAVSALCLALAAVVLILTCVNLTNLLMIRAMARERELGMRAILGATRTRLIRQLITEVVVLALAGAVSGIGLGLWTSRVFASPQMEGVPIHLDSSFDWRVFAFAVAATAFTALALGALPAVRAAPARLAMVSRAGGGRLSPRGQRLRTALVAFQVAGSFSLLLIAGLLVRSLENARRLDLGFDATHVYRFNVDPNFLGYDVQRGAQFFGELLRRVGSVHGVEAASLGCCGPMTAAPLAAAVRLGGYAPSVAEPAPTIFFNEVSRDFFRTLRIPLLEGRLFALGDNSDAARVAVINQTMAKRFWPGRSPLGQTLGFVGDVRPPMQIIGVVKDGRNLGILEGAQPYFYVPLAQNYGSSEVLFVRSSLDEKTVIDAVRAEIRGLAPGLPVTGVGTLLQQIDESGGLGLLRASALIATALGALGAALALVGLYGVVSYNVQRRRAEIGIRLALGASPGRIGVLVIRDGLLAGAAGIIVGALLSVLAAPLVKSFLVGVAPTDPTAFLLNAGLLLGVIAAAAYVPVQRAMRVDPVVTLRSD